MSEGKTKKRTNEQPTSAVSPPKAKKLSTKELNAYFKTYKNGDGDFHWPMFRELNKLLDAKTVLYPGCHRHITASLIFPDVVYVDYYTKIADCFTDPKVLEWVNAHKEYDGSPKIIFKCGDFESPFGEEKESFDLAISLSAGIVTKSCSKYVKPSGHFLVSDAHYDARMLHLDPNFQLTHVWDDSTMTFNDTAEALKGHFTTRDGNRLTEAMVQESIDKPKAKRSFKLQKEALFYLFKKLM
eukprot:GHVO01040857.1.p1 GENE.GHVO01040857.1~~GHVO01040857.1.p1  ORF type:complete len:241 (+),score=41.38 GHVO01040857.1:162-884(+)